MRRYTASTLATAQTATPIVEPVHGAPERTLSATAATLLEHAAVALSWAGVVVAGVLLWEAADLWPLARWQVALYGGAIVFLCAFCGWATWHFSLDERLRKRDLREWLTLESDFAQADLARRNLAAELDRVRHELSQAHSTIEGLRTSKNFTPAAPTPAEVRESTVGEDARQRFEACTREIVRRFELGLSFTRDEIVATGYTRGEWGQAMKAIERAGMARKAGQGGKMVITAHRGRDILDAVL